MSDDREPDWLDTIRNRVLQPLGGPEPSVNGALKRAAILVLLVDSDDGPNLLLTERAAALANYPGILVFPGGSAETIDDGPVATALREAAEETGPSLRHYAQVNASMTNPRRALGAVPSRAAP